MLSRNFVQRGARSLAQQGLKTQSAKLYTRPVRPFAPKSHGRSVAQGSAVQYMVHHVIGLPKPPEHTDVPSAQRL